MAPTTLTAGDILSVGGPTDLRALGSFTTLKASMNALLGVRLATRSWDSLFQLISDIQTVALTEPTLRTGVSQPLSEAAKTRLSDVLLSASAIAQPSYEQQVVLSHAIAKLAAAARDPVVRFNATRSRNFHHSSRLEGIDMQKARPADSLQVVLNRHRKR